MDDMTAFERQVTTVLDRMGGPEPSFDPMEIVRATTAPALTRTRRFQTMFSASRVVIAGAIVAVSGGLLFASISSPQQGGMTLPGAEASASPSPLASSAAIDPCTTPIVPVTGTIEWGYEMPGAQTFVSETGTHIRGWTFVSTLVMDDDRLDGTTTGAADHWDASDAAGVARGIRRVENADGTWEGPEVMITKLNESGVGLLPADPANFRDMWDLVGSGAYAGLSATLFLDADDLRGGSDYPTLEGSIYPTALASCDFASTSESPAPSPAG